MQVIWASGLKQEIFCQVALDFSQAISWCKWKVGVRALMPSGLIIRTVGSRGVSSSSARGAGNPDDNFWGGNLFSVIPASSKRINFDAKFRLK